MHLDQPFGTFFYNGKIHFSRALDRGNTMFDINRIKSDISIESLIAQSFTVVGGGDVLTTEEHDSLKIFVDTNSFSWYSQTKKNGKPLGGSVIDWYAHTHNCDAGAAIRALSAMLDGGALQPPPKRIESHHKPKDKPVTWDSPEWQENATRRLEVAQERLWDIDDKRGEPGRAYLAKRGIHPDMALAFGLGFADAYNITAKRLMPALWLPWMRNKIAAIQYRFIDVVKGDKTADRMLQEKGGNRYLFGVQHCAPAGPGELDTLILVEGEINAISIFQSAYGQLPVDAVSFGPQTNIGSHNRDMIAHVAGRYKRIILWADEPHIALSAVGSIPGAIPVQSPEIDGKRRDANDLLQSGDLDDLLFDIIQYAKTK